MGAVLLTMIPIAPLLLWAHMKISERSNLGVANARHGDQDLAFKVMRSSHGTIYPELKL